MKSSLRAKLLAGVLAVSGVAYLVAPVPASAQDYSDGYVSFRYFHDRLAQYGDWVYSDRWGEVWVPGDVPPDFHPYYSDGHWDYTDEYGWYWDSDYEWGDIVFHYGRWVYDQDDGWLWIPGYVWGPGWVVWRANEGYSGWMPMPPDDQFLGGYYGEGGGVSASFRFGGRIGISIDFNDMSDFFGYRRWYGRDFDDDRFSRLWVFVGTGHLCDRDYRPFIVNRTNVVNIIHNTTNITNYTVINNYVVNRSVDIHAVERAGGRPVQVFRAAEVIRRPELVTRLDVGHRIESQTRQVIPVGHGVLNSAPKPPQRVIETLSEKPIIHGRESTHLFTKTTIDRAVALPPPTRSFKPDMTTDHVLSKPNPATGTTNTGPTGETPAERAARLRQERLNSGNPPVNTSTGGGANGATTGETPAERAARQREELMKQRMEHMGSPSNPSTDNSAAAEAAARERAAKLKEEQLNQERLDQERLNQERLNQERVNQERLNEERLNQERLNQERLNQERLNQERLNQERANQDRLNQERLNQERINQERAAAEAAAQERAKAREEHANTPPPKGDHGDKEKDKNKKGDNPQ